MNKFSILVCLLFLNGCCYNQYARSGYSVGLDCFIPSVPTDKKCEINDLNNSCDEQVVKIKASIEARSKH